MKAVVIPVLKPNKGKHKTGNYRPIGLTCCFCKILKKIVNKWLRWYLESNQIITKFHSGFRQYCSIADCLIPLESSICNAISNNNHLSAVCLDLEKAYNLFWRNRILILLKKHKITGNLFCFIKNFLTLSESYK